MPGVGGRTRRRLNRSPHDLPELTRKISETYTDDQGREQRFFPPGSFCHHPLPDDRKRLSDPGYAEWIARNPQEKIGPCNPDLTCLDPSDARLEIDPSLTEHVHMPGREYYLQDYNWGHGDPVKSDNPVKEVEAPINFNCPDIGRKPLGIPDTPPTEPPPPAEGTRPFSYKRHVTVTLASPYGKPVISKPFGRSKTGG